MLTPYEQSVLDAVAALWTAINNLTVDSTDREYSHLQIPALPLEQLEQGIWAAVGRRLAEGS